MHLFLLLLTPGPALSAAPWRARVSADLQSTFDAPSQHANTTHVDAKGRVEADVHYNCANDPPLSALTAAGMTVSVKTKLPPLCVVEGWIAPIALPNLAAIPDITVVKTPSYVHHTPRPTQKVSATATKQIDGNAVTIMHADQFVAQAGGGGKGVTVGVQSAGIANLSTIQNRDEVPTVQVLTSAAGGQASAADEGTALLEEIHAVAPNATLAFCEPQTFVQFTACLQQFAKIGATIMVDDVLFLDQDPMDANGTDTQAVTQFLTQNPNVALFTAGGNDNGSYWEGTYNPVSVGSVGMSPITCPGSTQVDHYVAKFTANGSVNNVLTTPENFPISVPATFAWSDPPGQNGSKFDVYWVNAADPTQSGCLSTAGATGTVLSQSMTVYPGVNNLYIATPDASPAGKFLKLRVGGDGLSALSVSTTGSFVSPQEFAAGAITIGAVNGADGIGNNIESFSSRGPISIIFPTPAKLPAPTLVAPDGIYVDAAGTYFTSTLFPDGNFYGTSASAPNAAAVAALIRGAFPNLTVAQLLTALETGAAQLGASPPDGVFGYGRVDAMGALATFAPPTITALTDVTIDAKASRVSISQPLTVSGTGSIHLSVTSTNTTLIPTTGVTVSPSDCGASTQTCAVTVSAAQYQGGTATVTVSAVDGAGRSAPATIHVTVNTPETAPPPTPSSTPSQGGGGAFQYWDLSLLFLILQLKYSLRAVSDMRRRNPASGTHSNRSSSVS